MSRSTLRRFRASHTALRSATLAFQSLIALTALFFWALPADAADYYFNSRDEAAAACAQAGAEWPYYPVHQYGCRDQFSPGPPRINGITTCCGGWETLRDQFFYAVSACTSGAQFSFPGICAPAKNNSRCSSSPDAASGSRGNPCNAATGNKFQTESDEGGTTGVPVVRYYNSQFPLDVGFGFGWTSTLQSKHLYVGTSSVQVVRADANVERFICSAGVCQGDPDTHLTLTQDSAGYTLTVDIDNAIERYNLSGNLLSHTDRVGRVTSYSYDASGRIASVTSPFGHVLTLAYDTNNHVTSVTNAAGQVIRYSYDAYNSLVRVNYPDNTAKIYHYEKTTHRNHLTGISHVDTLGNVSRYSTYGYDMTGKAISTEYMGGIGRFTFSYDSATQTTVRDAATTTEVMVFATTLGTKNLVSNTNQADGKSLEQVFDGNNNLTCKKDEEGKVTTYTYNTTNQKTSTTEGLTGNCVSPVTTSATRTTTYQYLSPTLDLPTVVDSPSVYSSGTKRTQISYQGNLPATITQSGYTPTGTAISRSIALGYNSVGQVSSINGPRTDVSDITTLAYNTCTTGGACGQLQSITNALGQITTFNTYDANGRVTQTTDPNGLRTNYTYDPRGRVITLTQTPPTGTARTTSYTYNAAGNVTSTTFPDGKVLTYTYSAAQKLTRITDNLGNRIDYNYDLKGNRTQEQTFDPDSALVRSIDVAYDIRNRTSSINAGGSLTQTVHDAIGNLVSQTDPKNNPATVHTPDALNRLIQTLDRIGGTTSYAYDTNDRLKQVTAPNNAATIYGYDDLGNLLQESSPDRGPTTYSYDAAGNVTTITDARGIQAIYSYDALNRVTAVTYPNAAENIAYTYDIGVNCGSRLGRLCQAVDASGTTEYTYNVFGNIISSLRTELNIVYTTSYTYDPADRITSITYPDGRIVTYSRNSVGYIQDINATVNNVNQTIVNNRIYRADGQLTNQTFSNGLSETRQYDLQGRLTHLILGNFGTTVYSYDLNGNVTDKTVSTAPPPPPTNHVLLADYDFNGQYLDLTGRGHNGQVNGSVAFVPGVEGQALDFNGVANTYVNLGPFDDFEGLSAYTIAAWIKVKTISPAWQFFLGKATYSAAGDVGLHCNYANCGFWSISTRHTETSFTGLTNQWHHWAVTYENNTLRLYIDGVLKGQGSYNATPGVNNFTFKIGTDNEGQYPGQFQVDSLKIYQGALSQSEIQQLVTPSPPAGSTYFYDPLDRLVQAPSELGRQ